MGALKSLYDFLKANVDAAIDGDPMFGAEVHQTVKETITKDFGIRIDDMEADLAPGDANAMREFDAETTLIVFYRVANTDNDTNNYALAMGLLETLNAAFLKLFMNTITLGSVETDVLTKRTKFGFDNISRDESYAVANTPLIINKTGRKG